MPVKGPAAMPESLLVCYSTLARFCGKFALAGVRAVLGLRRASKGVLRTIKTSASRCTRRRAVELSPWLREQKHSLFG